MIAGLIARFITPNLLWILAGLLAMATAAAGMQTLRLAWLQTSTAEAAREASEEAREKYQARTRDLNTVAANLVHVQGERDAALKASGRKVIQYITRPGPPVQCFDDDGLHIIADLARGKSTDPGSSAGALPGRAAAAD